MNSALLERVLSAPRLPTLPAVAMRVIELTQDKDVSLKELSATIQNDQALASKVLRTVNSSFYGLSKKCTTISQAMVALGINTVKTLALGFSLVKMVKDGAQAGFDYEEYWQRGIYTGAAARAVAGFVKGIDPEEVFLGGILQDVGMVALFQALGQEYLSVLSEAQGDHRGLTKAEIKALEMTHADIGAMLAQRWKLPDRLVSLIKYHERPTAGPLDHASCIRVVGLGNIAADLLAGRDAPNNLRRFHERCAQWFAMNADGSEALLKKIGAGAKELAQLLRVDIGHVPSEDEILAIASERMVQISLEQEREAGELAEKNASLQREAVTDSLTGAWNRKHFNEASQSAFDTALKNGGCMAVVFFDADKFKSVNDTHGHQAGDAVLMELALRMKRHFEPAGGLVCRYGGEEFAVVLDGKNRADAAKLAESFRVAQEGRPIDIRATGAATQEITVTVSIGVAAVEPQTSHVFATVEQLIRAADQAVYAAKGSGRNCVRVFNPKPKTIAA